MICYLDSSVVIRKLLRESQQLAEWDRIQQAFSSQLLRLETLRSLDRMQLTGAITGETAVEARSRFFELLRDFGLLPLTKRILDRAEQTMPVPLGSLDSIHLATALFWRELHGTDFVFATHDGQLALAARAHGFSVIGI